MKENKKPLRSGDKIPNLAGGVSELPYAGEHPCFGQRQGWCNNQAQWRMEGPHLLLHFCDDCKQRPNFAKPENTWTAMDKRPDPKVH